MHLDAHAFTKLEMQYHGRMHETPGANEMRHLSVKCGKWVLDALKIER